MSITGLIGVTFDNQTVRPSDDGILHRSMLYDGILSDCKTGYSRYLLVIKPGALLICGRQFRFTFTQNIPVSGASSGYARIVFTVDLSKTSTSDTFEQIDVSVEYSETPDGFADVQQDNINNTGTLYQYVFCVVSLSSDGISGFYQAPMKASAALNGPIILTEGVHYGSTLPTEPTAGRLFFLAVGEADE